MNCNDASSLLDDLVDGELEPRERDELERHLAGCGTCRDALDELKRLVAEAHALPRSVSPPRDLMPGIRRTLREERPSTPPIGGWAGWIGLAASLLVVAAAGTVLWRGIPQTAAPPAETAGAIPAMVEYRTADREYTEAAAVLKKALEERAEGLSSETTRVIDRNLRIIDRAIEEVRTAIETDPSNLENGRVLTALHHQRLEFLWRVTRLSS